MKKEQKEKIVKVADRVCKGHKEPGGLKVMLDPKIIFAPDAYWVQAWILVPLDTLKS